MSGSLWFSEIFLLLANHLQPLLNCVIALWNSLPLPQPVMTPDGTIFVTEISLWEARLSPYEIPEEHLYSHYYLIKYLQVLTFYHVTAMWQKRYVVAFL